MPDAMYSSVTSSLAGVDSRSSLGSACILPQFRPSRVSIDPNLEYNDDDDDDGVASVIDKSRYSCRKSIRSAVTAHDPDAHSDYALNTAAHIWAHKTSLGMSMDLSTLMEPAIPASSKVRIFIRSHWFDCIIGALVCANAVFMGVSANYLAQHRTEPTPFSFNVLDVIFLFIFAMELGLRLFAWRSGFFKGKGWRWNLFDTIVVCLQFMEVMLKHVGGSGSANSVMGSVANVARIARLLRLVRLVHLIHALKSIVYLAAASMSSFFWTAMLLALLIYCQAVYFTELVATSSYEGEGRTELDKYWGSIYMSILSLYQAITGGISWGLVVKPLIDYVQTSGSVIIFAMYILFATLVMLNLVTGVFVEGAHNIIRQEKEDSMLRIFRKSFQRMDDDLSDDITWHEFQTQVASHGLDAYFEMVGLNRDQGKELFKLLDIDGNGSLSIEEFIEGSKRLNNPARCVDVALEQKKMQRNQQSILDVVNKLEGRVLKVASQLEVLSRPQPQAQLPSPRGSRSLRPFFQ